MPLDEAKQVRCECGRLGEVVGDNLTCAYHGFQYDAGGQCVAVPTEGGDCPLARRLRVPSYPAEERAGLIWGYIGDVALFPPPPLRMPEELDSAAWSGFIQQATWRTSWLRVWDNLADPMHGPFLHARSYTLSRGMRQDRMRFEDLNGGTGLDPRGPRRTRQRGVLSSTGNLGRGHTSTCVSIRSGRRNANAPA